jgi:uncharacterized protein (TIGR03435 family)
MTGALRLSGAVTLAIGAALVGPALLAGQQQQSASSQPPRAQEVIASIKPSPPGQTSSTRNTPGYFALTNYAVRGLVTLGYELQILELVDVPAWAEQERYDIVVKFDGGDTVGPANSAALHRALRQILVERFNLVLHRETRTLPVYLLEFDRTDHRLGAGLRPSTSPCRPAIPVPPGQRPCGVFGGALSKIQGDGVSLQVIAKFLSSAVQRMVVDRTGLPGTYDLDLSFTPDTAPQTDPDAPPSLFTAVREQLGLSLKSGTAPVEVTVVDRFERPTPD